MKCYDESILQRFADGELSALLKGRVASHVRTCGRCRDLLDRLNGENSELSILFGEGIAVPDLSQRIMDKIRKTGSENRYPGKSRIRLPVRGLQVAAAIFLVVLFLVFLFRDRDSGPFNGDRDILIQTARVEGRAVQTHLYASGDSNITFIWLEKM